MDSRAKNYDIYSMINTGDFRNYAVNHLNLNGLTVDQYTNNITNLAPYILEERKMNVSPIDVFSRLMMDRIIFIGTPIYDEIANIVTAQMLYLESLDANRDILLYINSPGGSVYAGLGIYDTMQYIRPDIATICTGMAASMGAILQCAGAEGKRSALKHARIMLHQPLGGAGGQASDIEIIAEQILILKDELYELVAKHSHNSVEKIAKDADRDFWMKAQEAKEYGLIDEVLERN